MTYDCAKFISGTFSFLNGGDMKSKYMGFFLVSMVVSFVLSTFLLGHPDPADIEKASRGLAAIAIPGVMHGVILALAMIAWYAATKRNIVSTGETFCCISGVLFAGPVTELVRGYPLEWALIFPPIVLGVVAIGYRTLYRFHFKEGRKA